jgi:hypothetical protein
VEFANSLGFVMLPIAVALYLLPSGVAIARNHNRRRSIFLLNILLGWTVMGWLVPIVWAASALSGKK